MHSLHLLLPLISAILYAFGALLIKRAGDLGVGLWRTALISNLCTACLYQVLWIFGGTIHFEKLWQPALIALCFMAGQTLNFVALDIGDVSVATPVLGIKIVLVAFFVTLLGGEIVTFKFWIAAALATAAIALLNRRGQAQHHHVGFTIAAALVSSACFALFDVLVRRWAPAWGLGTFLPLILIFVGLFSFGYVPLFKAPLRDIPLTARPWLFGGAALFAAQSVVFVSTVAAFGNVTAANIVFSSRGLWSVAIVWLAGHWFSNREQNLGTSVLRGRLIGALLMMAAIALVLV